MGGKHSSATWTPSEYEPGRDAAWYIGAQLVGAIAGAEWMHPSEFWLALVLASIGGTFLYLSVSGLTDALLPQSAPKVVAES